MKTLFLVMAKYESEDIPLDKICEEHFGMSISTASRKASAHQLPVPFYKKSGKSGFFCSTKAWADFIDAQAEAAQKEWERMNG